MGQFRREAIAWKLYWFLQSRMAQLPFSNDPLSVSVLRGNSGEPMRQDCSPEAAAVTMAMMEPGDTKAGLRSGSLLHYSSTNLNGHSDTARLGFYRKREKTLKTLYPPCLMLNHSHFLYFNNVVGYEQPRDRINMTSWGYRLPNLVYSFYLHFLTRSPLPLDFMFGHFCLDGTMISSGCRNGSVNWYPTYRQCRLRKDGMLGCIYLSICQYKKTSVQALETGPGWCAIVQPAKRGTVHAHHRPATGH